MYQLEQLAARERIREISHRREPVGVRRSARLIAIEIRSSRRHKNT